MLHDQSRFEDAEPFITLPRLRPLPHPDAAFGTKTHPELSGPALACAGGPAQTRSCPPMRGENGAGAGTPDTPPAPALDRATISPALLEIAALRREQIVKWGHTPEKDLAAPVGYLPQEAKSLLAGACDDIQFHRAGPAFAEARPRIRKRLLKAGAMIAAALDRLDAEPDDSADWPSL